MHDRTAPPNVDRVAASVAPAATATGSETAGFARDVATLTVVRLVGVGAAFLTSVVGARLLGPAELGIGGVALTLGMVAALVANGGVTMSTVYMLRRAAHPWRIASGLAGLTLVTIALAILFAGIVVATFGALAGWAGLAWIAVATGLLGGSLVWAETAGAQLLGLERTATYRLTEAVRPIAALVATVVLLLVATNAGAYVVAAALGYIAAGAVAVAGVRDAGGWGRPRFDGAVWREALAYGLRGQVGNVLQFLTLRVDLVIVAALLGPVPAGLYFVAARVSEVVTQLANSTASLLFPVVSGGSPGSSTILTARATRAVTLAVAAAAVVLGVLAVPLLPAVFGSEFGPAVASLGLLLVAAVPLSVARILGGDLKGRGRPGIVSTAAGLGLAILVAGDLLFVPAFGIEGAAAVSIAAYLANAVALAFAWRDAAGARLADLVPGPSDVKELVGLGRRVSGSVVSRPRGGGTPSSGRG